MSTTPTQSTPWQRPAGSWGSGTVTAPGVPPASPPPPPAPPGSDGPQRRRRQMLIFGAIAGAILAAGLAIILIVVLSSDGNPFGDKASAPTDVRPPLAQACPAPTVPPSNPPVAPPPSALAPAGARTVDQNAGITYKAYGPPWVPWDEEWKAGTLQVPYKVGQHFVTEVYPGGEYHAS